MEEKKIFLQPDDEITDVIDKIKGIDKPIVVLVIPESAMVLQSIVNLKLLKRQADNLGKRIAIVTDSEKGRQLAGQVGISVYQKAKANEIEKEETEKQALDEVRSRFPMPERKKTKETDNNVSSSAKTDQKKKPKRKLAKVLLVSLLVVLIGASATWAYVGLPKAEVDIKVDRKDLQKKIAVIAKVDFANELGDFKSELISETATSSIKADATGRKEVGGSASGKITIYNYWSSDPQPLVATTRFVHSSTGKLFRTTESVTVPGTQIVEGQTVAGTTTVTIKASEIGSDYNVGPGKFTIPGLPSDKQSKIYGRTESGITGGYEKEILVVSQNDYDQAKSELEGQLDQEIDQKIKNQIDEGYLILDNKNEKILEESANPDVGQEAGSFKLTIKKEVKTLIYKKEDFLRAVKEQFDSGLSAEMELSTEDLESKIKVLNINFDPESKEAKIKMTVDGEVVAKIDQDIIKESLVGRDKGEGEKYLTGYSQIEDAAIDFWPFWVKRVPNKLDRIIINLVHE